MEEQRRELERQAALGDTDAQYRVDLMRLRSGEAPSWDYLLAEEQRVKELQQHYLAVAIERELAAFFQKHPPLCGIKSLSWGIFPRHDCSDYGYNVPDNWDIEGLIIDIDPYLWGETCQISPSGDLDFEAPALISHLKGVCNCKGGDCWIGMFEEDSEEQKQALLAALQDTLLIFKKLHKTPRELISQKASEFAYIREKGFIEKDTV